MNASQTRYIILVVAVINAVLNLIGFETFPEETTNNIVAVASGVYFLYMAWKNNYLSRKGKQQEKVLEQKNLK